MTTALDRTTSTSTSDGAALTATALVRTAGPRLAMAPVAIASAVGAAVLARGASEADTAVLYAVTVT
ncbi:MAG: hypothetical protein M3N25_07750, partial [Actinomycetota bacterium]|nr:hypothetical protein [Actinomycetota bacterium]